MSLPYQPKNSEILPHRWNREKIGDRVFVTFKGCITFGVVLIIEIRQDETLIQVNPLSPTWHSSKLNRFFTEMDNALSVLRDNIKAQVEDVK